MFGVWVMEDEDIALRSERRRGGTGKKKKKHPTTLDDLQRLIAGLLFGLCWFRLAQGHGQCWGHPSPCTGTSTTKASSQCQPFLCTWLWASYSGCPHFFWVRLHGLERLVHSSGLPHWSPTGRWEERRKKLCFI